MTKVLATLLVVLTTLGCGYRLAGRSPNPAPVDLNGKSVSVHILKNHTGEPDVEYIITKAIVTEFIRTPQIRVVRRDKDADYIMEGDVTKYHKEVLSLDYRGTAQYYRLVVTINVRLHDPSSGKTIKLGSFSEDSEFHMATDVEVSKAQERAALKRVSQELAQRLSAMLL